MNMEEEKERKKNTKNSSKKKRKTQRLVFGSFFLQRDSLTNTQLALHLAEENNVPALLDAGDLVAVSQKRFDESSQQSIYEVHPPSVDEFSLVVYLSILYQV